MNTLELKDAIESYAIQNGLEKKEIVDVLSDVIINELSEYLNVIDDEIHVEVDDNYNILLFLEKEIVAEKDDLNTQLTLPKAQEIDADAKIGDVIKAPIDLNILSRRDIKKLNSLLMYKLRNIHKEVLYREYKAKEGEIINGTFVRRAGRDLFVDIGKTEGRLSYRDQSPKEFYKQGDKIRCYLREVILDENNRLCIYLSRTDPEMIKKLFEIEVPEIAERVVEIQAVVREPGHKVKLSVISNKVGVEPVGTCVGLAGIRIKAVIKELGGEKIDVIPHSTNAKEFLAKAMQPAQVEKILIINNESKNAIIVVEDEVYPLAIGRGGVNIKLASRLTGWTINLKTVSQIQKRPEILKIFSEAESFFNNEEESDLHQLTEVQESLIVKLMNAGIMNISDLYEKKVDELAKIEGITLKDAQFIRNILDELVEVVDDEEIAQATRKEYMSEFEDEISGVDTNEEIKEEVRQVDYLQCPSCGHEFEYTNQEKCPSCKVEFEFAEEEGSVDYFQCHSCGHEFEYTNQEKCPSCKVEFEFAEEVKEKNL